MRPDLVLMDINLAGDTDGITAATAIRHELHIPCVFLTGYATNDVVKRANEVLPAGQTLTVTFTDIDLAGDFEPWRGGQAMDIRIVKDVYPPRMDLESTDHSVA